MNDAVDLAALVEQPFALLQELERRSRAAIAGQGTGSLPAEWVGVGFRIGQESKSFNSLCQYFGVRARGPLQRTAWRRSGHTGIERLDVDYWCTWYRPYASWHRH